MEQKKTYKGYKCRLYPNKEQREYIDKSINCSRFIYNKLLDIREREYKENEKTLSRFDLIKLITELKKDERYAFLREVDITCLRSSADALVFAYNRFFDYIKRVKNGEKPELEVGYPQFKKKSEFGSYTVTKSIGILENNKIKLPKISAIKYGGNMPKDKDIVNATVTKKSTGKYYVSVTMAFEPEQIEIPEGTTVGISMGVNDFIVDTNGKHIENPLYYKKAEARLRKLNSRLSRMTPHSNNYKKQQKKIAVLSEHIKNQRLDFQHKISTQYIRENETICIKDYDIAGMMQNKKYGKALADSSFATFSTMLKYKSEWYGNTFIKVPKMLPATRICGNCGAIRPASKVITGDTWVCDECKTKLNKRENTALVVLQSAFKTKEEINEIVKSAKSKKTNIEG